VSLTSDILDLRAIHLSLYSEWNNLTNDLNSLAAWLSAEGNPSSGAAASAMAAHTLNIRALYMGASPSMRNTTYAILHYIDDNLNGGAPPYELTMEKILAAMWDSDKLMSFQYINYIDAMRASIWNVEIYETHLADWYRHFNL